MGKIFAEVGTPDPILNTMGSLNFRLVRQLSAYSPQVPTPLESNPSQPQSFAASTPIHKEGHQSVSHCGPHLYCLIFPLPPRRVMQRMIRHCLHYLPTAIHPVISQQKSLSINHCKYLQKIQS